MSGRHQLTQKGILYGCPSLPLPIMNLNKGSATEEEICMKYRHRDRVSVTMSVLHTPPEFTIIERWSSPLKLVLRRSMGVLLMIRGKCSCLRAKSAHSSGKLPRGAPLCVRLPALPFP